MPLVLEHRSGRPWSFPATAAGLEDVTWPPPSASTWESLSLTEERMLVLEPCVFDTPFDFRFFLALKKLCTTSSLPVDLLTLARLRCSRISRRALATLRIRLRSEVGTISTFNGGVLVQILGYCVDC